jgi:(+)-trans-carveol dehydrogenase
VRPHAGQFVADAFKYEDDEAQVMTDLAGRVAVITGGARGQGRAHAVSLARAGADIAVCDVVRQYSSVPYAMATESDLAQTVELVERLGRRCVAVKADVAQAVEVQNFMSEAFSQLGRVDFVVANAGIWSLGGPMWEIGEAQFDETIAVDVKGVWLTCKYAIPYMLEQKSGSIVLTSSVAGKKAYPNAGHYVSAKHGVIGMMKTLALELAPHNIRVNALLPGMVNTDMVFFQEQYELFSPDNPTMEGYLDVVEKLQPMPGRWTEPEDQANAVLWLCSDESRYVTGMEMEVAAGSNI